jgi:hypothetical protein
LVFELSREEKLANLTVVDILGQRHYRLNLAPTTGYRGAGDTIVAAPVIHTYTAWSFSIIAGLALQADEPMMTMGKKQYQVKKFLTVQRLNEMFLEDNGAKGFTPTVKPHYAIAPHNAKGIIYKQQCKTLVEACESGDLLMNGAMPVHAHDGKVSPSVEIKTLKKKLIQAVAEKKSSFYASYVVDEHSSQILITQHCLLMEQDYEMLFQTLDAKETPTLADLMLAKTSIQEALDRFSAPVGSDHPLIQAVFLGQGNTPPKVKPEAPKAKAKAKPKAAEAVPEVPKAKAKPKAAEAVPEAPKTKAKPKAAEAVPEAPKTKAKATQPKAAPAPSRASMPSEYSEYFIPAKPFKSSEPSELQQFELCLEQIKIKKDEMQGRVKNNSNYTGAAKKASKLYITLRDAKQDFLALDDRAVGKTKFIQACRDAIAEARPELETHRGWSQVFLDILNVLACIGTLGIASGVAKYKWDSYRLFRVETDSATKLRECDDALDSFEQAAPTV